MRVFWALVWREVRERRLLLLASLFLGIVAIVLPWVPGRPERYSPDDIRTAATAMFVILFGGAGLAILGGSIVGRDLSEQRMGFFYSRPIGGWTLWLSRLTAATILLVVSLLLLIIPTASLDADLSLKKLFAPSSGNAVPLLAFGEIFYHDDVWLGMPKSLPVLLQWLFFGVVLITLLALCHVIGTMIRARSLWALADFAGLALVVGLGWRARDLLVGEEAFGALIWAERGVVFWVLAAVILAGGRQLTLGRTDLRLGHRHLSSTLWAALIAGGLLFLLYAGWVARSKAEDLMNLRLVQQSPDAEWLLAGGDVRYRHRARAAFLVNARDERSWRLGSLGVVRQWHDFSDDSSTLAWGRCESFRPLICEVWTQDLSDPESAPRASGVPLQAVSSEIVLSGDGSRIAVFSWKRIEVYELDGARLITAVDANEPRTVQFMGRDEVRFHDAPEAEAGWGDHLRIRSLDLVSRQVRVSGRMPLGLGRGYDAQHDVTFFWRIRPGGFGLYEAETGKPLVEDIKWQHSPFRGFPLDDGRWLVSFRQGDGLQVQVLRVDGQVEQAFNFRDGSKIRFGGHLGDGRQLLAVFAGAWDAAAQPLSGIEPQEGWTLYALDIDSGEREPLTAGLVPIGPPKEALGSRFFQATAGTVVHWDPSSTEAPKVIVSAS